MTPKMTATEPQLTRAALTRLPHLIEPRLAGLARTLRRGLEQQGLTIETSTGPEGLVLTDTAPQAFAREFGTLDTPPQPILQDLVAQAASGLIPPDETGGETP